MDRDSIPCLTPAERLILIGQIEIKMMLKDLNNDEDRGFIHESEAKIEALEYGFEGEYGRLASLLSEPLSVADCDFVLSVMQMYEALDEKFPGFNEHNSESKYESYARFLLKTGQIEKTENFRNVKLMAHSVEYAVPSYRESLKIWGKLGFPRKMMNNLTDEMKKEILSPARELPNQI